MQDIVDIINDLEKENKLIDISNKRSAFAQEANNITRALNAMYDNTNPGFRLEYCSIADKNNNNVYYYRFSIYSFDTLQDFSRKIRGMDRIEKNIVCCYPDATFCIRESDLSEREINILKVIAKPKEYYKENIDSFGYKEKHLKLFEYMEYMMALSLVKCLENSELIKVEIINLKNELYRKKEEIDEKILAEK